MPVLLVIVTIYVNHSAQTMAVPMDSMHACSDIAASLQRQLAAVAPPSGDTIHVISKCVRAKKRAIEDGRQGVTYPEGER